MNANDILRILRYLHEHRERDMQQESWMIDAEAFESWLIEQDGITGYTDLPIPDFLKAPA